jgi:hypothetical protein
VADAGDSRFTSRLRLVPVGPGNAPDLWLVHNDDEVSYWYGNDRPSFEEAERWFGEARRAPDVVLCDFHLAAGEKGGDTIERIRRMAGCCMPAVLVTGDVLGMSRILSLLPFFVVGLFLQPHHFEMLRRSWVRVISAIVILATIALSVAVRPLPGGGESPVDGGDGAVELWVVRLRVPQLCRSDRGGNREESHALLSRRKGNSQGDQEFAEREKGGRASFQKWHHRADYLVERSRYCGNCTSSREAVLQDEPLPGNAQRVP